MLRKLYRLTLYRFIFGSYDRVLILSEEEHRALTRLLPEHRQRFKTAANPYVASEMLAAAPNRRPGGAHILALARMMPQKRLDRLLDAFARVSNKQARLTILGDGPERNMLERRARALGIEERVSMPGFVEDVLPWLRCADLFALSSDYEGLPAAVLEALACNVPVVTTDCFDAARSLLAGASRCATVPRGDVDAFARAIDESLATSEIPMNLDAIARPYAFDTAIAAHVDVLRDMLARRSS
jgi:glycosyltransferase involved in cell wall biosynthesis